MKRHRVTKLIGNIEITTSQVLGMSLRLLFNYITVEAHLRNHPKCQAYMASYLVYRRWSFAFGFWNTFGHFRQRSDVFGKLSEVAVTFSEIPVMTRRKSYAFDSVKVARYT